MAFDNLEFASDGGDDGSVFWDVFKLVVFVIGALVLISWVFRFLLAWAVPLIVIAILAFAGYKLFIEEDDSDQVGPPEDPPLLEEEIHTDTATDDILDEDPLEKEFQELEQRDSSST